MRTLGVVKSKMRYTVVNQLDIAFSRIKFRNLQKGLPLPKNVEDSPWSH